MARKLFPSSDDADQVAIAAVLNDGLSQPVDADEQRAAIVATLRTVGVRPALVYAFERTGLLVTTENRKLISASDLDEWEDAIAEYEEKHPGA